MRTIAGLMTVLLLTACGGSGGSGDGQQDDPGYVSRAAFGDDWPLTVADGVLRCEGAAVIFRTGGTDYGVNGAAARFADIDPIWADDPSGVSPKKSIGPLIERGLTLCA